MLCLFLTTFPVKHRLVSSWKSEAANFTHFLKPFMSVLPLDERARGLWAGAAASRGSHSACTWTHTHVQYCTCASVPWSPGLASPVSIPTTHPLHKCPSSCAPQPPLPYQLTSIAIKSGGFWMGSILEFKEGLTDRGTKERRKVSQHVQSLGVTWMQYIIACHSFLQCYLSYFFFLLCPNL